MANNYYELQYTGNKVIQWKNFTDTSTPLSAANLQKSHQAIDDMDQAVNAAFRSVDNTKLDKTLAGSMLIGVTYNDETGQMVFKHYDNSIPDITFNTNLQKLVVNFSYDPETQKLILTQADGSTVRVDLSAFVANPDLENSDTISWTINQDGSISANVKNGSITDAMLESGYLAQVTAKASAAAASATNADYYSKLSKSYANGTSNLQDRPNENVDNSKYFKEESEAWAVGKKNGSDVPSSASQYHNNSKYWAEQAAQSSGAVDMRGATATTAGAHGLAPAPAAGDNEKFLRGDGSWAEASASDFTGATSSSDGAHGLVPAPQIADKDKFLKGDGSWAEASYDDFKGATSSANGTHGLVPQPLIADKDKFLKGDGSWGDVPNPQVMTGASASAAGESGLAPQPTAGQQNATLFGDGSWKTLLYDALSRYENAVTGRSYTYSGDLNDITQNCIVNTDGSNANRPSGTSNWGFVVTLMHSNSNNYATQIYITMNEADASKNMFFRDKANGTWQSWKRLLTENDLTSINTAIGNKQDKLTLPLSVANGGTGQTTLALARNAMGLGNTTGALPVANGGTGATTAAGALTNLNISPTEISTSTYFSSISSGISFDQSHTKIIYYPGLKLIIVMIRLAKKSYNAGWLTVGAVRSTYLPRINIDGFCSEWSGNMRWAVIDGGYLKVNPSSTGENELRGNFVYITV